MKYKYTLYYSILSKVYSKLYIPNIFTYLYLKYVYNYIAKVEYLIPNNPLLVFFTSNLGANVIPVMVL